MSELSDYRRLIEKPMIESYEATIKSLRAELAKARLAASPQGMVLAGWQTMDSAPKDGVRLLLAFETRFETGYWSDMQHQWVDGVDGCQFVDETPLAWCCPPLPRAALTSTAEQGEKL